MHPFYPKACKLQGGVLLALGRMAEAEKLLARAVEQSPDYAEAWCDLGTTRRWLNDPQVLLMSTECPLNVH
jgi:Flp pilus assembly protein TadD